MEAAAPSNSLAPEPGLCLHTASADATRGLGRKLGAALGAPELSPVLILLRGDYGAGKTTFVQGLAAGLGVTGPTRSPSYLIVKVYEGTARRLVHADLYRVHSAAEVDELGIEELAGPEGVIAVEWPGEGTALVIGEGRGVIEVEFEYADKAEGRRQKAKGEQVAIESPSAGSDPVPSDLDPSSSSGSDLLPSAFCLSEVGSRMLTFNTSTPALMEVLLAITA